jgi:hypothetical protein
MKRTEENQFSMMRATQTVLNQNPAIVTAVPAIATAKTELDNLITEVSSAEQAQQNGSEGETLDKAATKAALMSEAEAIIGPVKAYARTMADNVLYDRVNYTNSALVRLTDTGLPDACQAVHDAASDNAAALASYGVTAAVITSLQTRIDAYRTMSSAPRAAIAQQKAQTERIASLMERGTALLKGTMDNLVLPYKTQRPVFFSEYTTARQIVDTGKRHTTIRGTVTDAATGQPLYNTRITIVELNRTTRSGADGVYGLQKFEGGVYTITAELKDYRTETKSVVEIQRGQSIEINFSLDRA